MRCDVATAGEPTTVEVPKFGTHPYNGSGALAEGFPDSLVVMRQCAELLLVLAKAGAIGPPDRGQENVRVVGGQASESGV